MKNFLNIFAILTILAITIMMAIEGTLGIRLHATPLFWTFAMILMLVLAYAVVIGIKKRKSIGSIASHAGLLMICAGAFFGALHFQHGMVIAGKDYKENVALSPEGMAVQLPFLIQLEEFRTDYYDDGTSPRQYTSVLRLDDITKETSVNHPCYYKGYFLYQSDFDREAGRYSVIKAVSDPWFPMIALGMILLAIGAFCNLGMNWKSTFLSIAVVLVAILFTVLSIYRINFGTLVPVLRSWWFVPHLVMYMIAYSALAIALVLAILDMAGVGKGRLEKMVSKLFTTGSSLLLLGMLCGSAWAKAAWGDWWMWDAKECWAAVTWLLTLCGMHLPHNMPRRKAAVLASIIISFAAMQMAWYGVEHVPAAKTSMHTYK